MVAKKKAATKKKPAKPVTPPPETDAVSPAVPGASRAGIAPPPAEPPAPEKPVEQEQEETKPINSIRAKVVDVLNAKQGKAGFTVLVCRAIHLANAGLLKVVGVANRGDEVTIDVTKKG